MASITRHRFVVEWRPPGGDWEPSGGRPRTLLGAARAVLRGRAEEREAGCVPGEWRVLEGDVDITDAALQALQAREFR